MQTICKKKSKFQPQSNAYFLFLKSSFFVNPITRQTGSVPFACHPDYHAMSELSGKESQEKKDRGAR